MTASKKKVKKKANDEASEYFAKFDELEEHKANRLLNEFHQRSQLLSETENELAEQMTEMLAPFKSIFEETHKHTQFRAACYSLFLDPSKTEVVELYKYEHEYEDL
jgi:DNA-directed RNA polymerase subunit F